MIDHLKKFLNEDQDPKAIEKLLPKVNSLLTAGEIVEYIAVQKKPAINISPDCIALTNKRIIFCRPKNLGLSMEFQDFMWKDISDCHMKESILGADFSILTTRRQTVMLNYLPKSQARKLYQFAQSKEEEMSEYRRQRELEDKRAAAGGGIIINNDGNAPQKNQDQPDPVLALQKLKMLLDSEIISKEEYELKKTDLLAKI